MDVQRIRHCLDAGLLPSARFLAERLLVIDPSPASRHLLALVLQRSGEYELARNIAAGSTRHAGCVYVYGQCCLSLGLANEGLRYLELHRPLQGGAGDGTLACLLGHLSRHAGDRKKAMQHYKVALLADPYLWEAFEGLCALGVNLRVDQIFCPPAAGAPNFLKRLSEDPEVAPHIADKSIHSPLQQFTRAQQRTRPPERKPRPPSRETLRRTTRSAASTENRTERVDAATDADRAARGPQSISLDPSTPSSLDFWTLLQKLAQGHLLLSRYECHQALVVLGSLPAEHRDTPWVLSRIGRAQFELADYPAALVTFERLRVRDPCRMEDMEVFSTLLWHLRNKVPLAFLAHQLVTLDRLAPETWCAIGNCYSLQLDHDTALKCFRRATQLDDRFAYAYTLQGHEHVANEEYEKATTAFRHAMRVDRRHYNAWYGLGMVYLRTGNFDAAEQHFKVAATINHHNPVLASCIGMVYEKQGRVQEALQQYERACTISPANAPSRFKKSKILIQLGDYEGALHELHLLLDQAPDEANVHFMLGRLYKHVNDKSAAVKHFTVALNLDPKAAQLIKEAIETLDDEDQDGSDEDANRVYHGLEQ